MIDSNKRANVLLSTGLRPDGTMLGIISENLHHERIFATSGYDIVIKHLNAHQYNNPFSLIIMADYSGRLDGGVSSLDAVRMLRIINKKVPIIMVSDHKSTRALKQADIDTWVFLRASDEDFVAAIKATIQRANGEIPEQTLGEDWTLIERAYKHKVKR